MEWYDFAVFGYLAGPLGHAFFPHVGGAWPLIASFSVFAAGYVMRPVGSLLLGPVGDRLGRRTMLSFSITLMGVASAGIAVLPTAPSTPARSPMPQWRPRRGARGCSPPWRWPAARWASCWAP